MCSCMSLAQTVAAFASGRHMHYAAGSTRPAHGVQVFGYATRVLDGSDKRGTLDHMDYYLACMRALARPKPVQTLFADDNVAIPTVRMPLWPGRHLIPPRSCWSALV